MRTRIILTSTTSFTALGLVLGLSMGSSAARAEIVETVTVTGQTIANADKGQTPLSETPQNIQFVSRELLIDQDVTRLDDALRNVAGVMGGGYYQSWDYFRIRGFDASGYIYQDSLKLDSGVQVNQELFGVERVEIVKGPASSLYGQGSLGGLVNLASKHPQKDRFLNLSASIGSYGSHEFTFDGNTGLAEDVEARLVALERHEGNFVQYAGGNTRVYVAPSLTWHIGEDTALTVLGSYQYDKMSVAFPLTYLGAVVPSVHGSYPLDTYTGEPGRSNMAESSREQIGYEFSHRFNAVFSFQQKLRYAWNDQKWDHLLYTSHLDADQRTLYRYPYNSDSYWTDFSVDGSFEAVFETGPVSHTMVFGADHFAYRARWGSDQIEYSDPGSYMPLDLYDPVYGTPFPDMPNHTINLEHTDDTGIYFQEHAKIGALTLTAGIRWDTTRFANSWNGDLSPHDNTAFVPRFGITYEIVPKTAVFASYSESFLPQSGSVFGGGEIDPESGRQWEVGVKSNLLNDRISFTASLYHLTRSHVAIADQAHPGFSVEAGEVRSRGFEFDGRAQLNEGWEMIATYAYVDAAIIEGGDYPAGDQPQMVPKNSFGLWSKYTFDGGLDGLSLNAGVYHYSSQAGDLPNSFRLPAYTLVNAAVAYDFGPASLQVSIKNLFDERYFSGSYNAVYVQPGFPRMVEARLSAKL